MSTGSGASPRRPLPALPLRRVLHLDATACELHAEMVGLAEVASGAGGGALVEPALLLGIRFRLVVTGDESQHAEHTVDLVEQMLQRALRLGAHRAGVELAVDVAETGEDD